jgi:thiopurine S-methyltransferase
MEHEFWHERWEKDEIGFHQVTVNEQLQRFLKRLDLPPSAHVLVPFCGKTLDMWWLSEHGYRVTGVELSPVAVKGFFEEAGCEPELRTQDGFTVHAAGGTELYCGDFFALEPVMIPAVDAVYDRAALVALPRAMRPAYVNHLNRFIRPGAQTLLITLDYPEHEMKGPPFAVTAAEVLCREDRLVQEPRFREKGLSRLSEDVYRLERRDA